MDRLQVPICLPSAQSIYTSRGDVGLPLPVLALSVSCAIEMASNISHETNNYPKCDILIDVCQVLVLSVPEFYTIS